VNAVTIMRRVCEEASEKEKRSEQRDGGTEGTSPLGILSHIALVRSSQARVLQELHNLFRPSYDCSSEKGEVLLRGVLTLRLVSHAQPARRWKTVFSQMTCSWFGNPSTKWFLGAGFLGAPPLSLKAEEFIDYKSLYAQSAANVEAAGKISSVEAVCQSAVKAAMGCDAKLIMALTETGHTALQIAKYRPQAPTGFPSGIIR